MGEKKLSLNHLTRLLNALYTQLIWAILLYDITPDEKTE
jgi:hypothetical protein